MGSACLWKIAPMTNKTPGLAEQYGLWAGWGSIKQWKLLVGGQSYGRMAMFDLSDSSENNMSSRFATLTTYADTIGLGLGASGGLLFGLAWNVPKSDPQRGFEATSGESFDWSLGVGLNFSGIIKGAAKGLGKALFSGLVTETAKQIISKTGKEAAKLVAEELIKQSPALTNNIKCRKSVGMTTIPIALSLEVFLGAAITKVTCHVVSRYPLNKAGQLVIPESYYSTAS